MVKTVCLLCGRSRVVTVCGDQSCLCTKPTTERPGLSPVVPVGTGFKGGTLAACGRLVPTAYHSVVVNEMVGIEGA